MFSYILKRLLMMIPTLFAICLIVFMIINLAPGKPGGQLMQGEGGFDAQQSKKRESYKIFKDQFNLDKPILINTRFALTDNDIKAAIDNIANLDGSIPVSKAIKSQEELEDWGNYAVPHLIAVLNKTNNPKLQSMVVDYLSLCARKRMIKPYAELSELSISDRQKNREIDQRNRYVSSLVFSDNATNKDKRDTIDAWNRWFTGNKEEYTYSTIDKVKIFFLDTRFSKYVYNISHLDFGISHVTKKPVIKTIRSKIKYSITLSLLAIFFSYLISIPIGVYSAVKQYSKGDRVLTVMLFVLYSLPNFFVGTLLLSIFSEGGYIPIFPTGGFMSANIADMTTLQQIKDIAWHLVLPLSCLTYASFAVLSRYARTGLLEVIRSDYIRTARAKGLPENVVIIRHAVRNGMIPILTLLASLLPILIGGSVIIETIFNIPGIGQFVYDSIFNRDYNAIMAVQLLTAILTMFGILISDISYALVDPRIKFK